MPTLSFYVRHILRSEEKIIEFLNELNNPDIGVDISNLDSKKVKEELVKGREFVRNWYLKKKGLTI